ncbi:MAG TPA: quinolinate synthase NadA [Bacteroidaceae bacterium]|nr:quinolinate synthase NadA [Bacteroidaceae bacterium]
MDKNQLIAAITQMKKEKNAIILAHYYSDPDIQDICDFLGDSLELARKAAETDADIIVFCGVHFMAETASLLSPEKKVIIPAQEAGCSLADGATAEQLRAWKAEHPGGLVISYVNTTAAVKSETDYCCTSANAQKIVASMPKNTPVVFVPDNNLGTYISKTQKTGEATDLHMWNGCCHVHQKITTEVVLEQLAKYPHAEFLIHPESQCSHSDEVVNHPRCFMSSTSGMFRHVANSTCTQFVLGTEMGTLHKMKKDFPDREFIMMRDDLLCESMKQSTLEATYIALKEERYVVTVSEDIAERAALPVKRMLQ